MAEALIIEDIERRTKVTLAGTVSRGNLVGYSSGWVAADADVAAGIYAEYIALDGGVSGDVINACKGATFYDGDAPYTANTPQYTSGTVGAITETRPATDGDLIQVVGRSIDTYRVRIDIAPPKEWEIFLSPDNKDTSSEPGLGVADAGWVGPSITGTEKFYFKGRLPSGIVGSISAAKIVLDSVNASAGDIDVTIVAANDGASNVEDTGAAITTGDWTQADADNIVLTMDISACFDSGLYVANRSFCVFVDPDGVTADALVIGLYLRGWKV